ncbi:MAG: hypothetical protein HOH74_02420, partial [Gemmatimonadetes bacterium]|nr:hypothetical protein [Gemmatimonadota bacterium]
MPITIDGGRITLRNAGIERIIETDEGLSTSRYFIAPEGVWGHGHFRPTFAFDAHLPFEFAITINGEEHLGGPLAYQPSWGQKRGSFSVVDVVQERGDIGDRVTLVTRPNQDGIPAVEIHVIYELSDDLPFLVKQIRVENLSPQPLVIDNLTVDILKALRLGRELLVTTDYYTYGAAKSQRDGFFASYERFCFASDIHLELAPGERFDSFRCIQTVGPGTADENSVVSQRVLKTLAPWIVANPVHVCVFRIDHIDELYAQVRQRRDDGAEYIEFFVGQLFTNTGDYIPRADLFPGGAADLKRLVGHCHDLGLKVATYCSLTIANHSSAVCIEHPDWQYLGPDGIRYHPEGFGNMCYQSGWGDYI